MSHLQAVRSDPSYVDQVPRRMAYQEAHPDVEIIWCGPHWKAIIPDGHDGSTEVNRLSLRQLLDKLDSIEQEMRRARESGCSVFPEQP